jgi:hypothetical protein
VLENRLAALLLVQGKQQGERIDALLPRGRIGFAVQLEGGWLRADERRREHALTARNTDVQRIVTMVLLRYLAGQPVPEVSVVLKAPVDGRAFRAWMLQFGGHHLAVGPSGDDHHILRDPASIHCLSVRNLGEWEYGGEAKRDTRCDTLVLGP